jgi:hypothetical protein
MGLHTNNRSFKQGIKDIKGNKNIESNKDIESIRVLRVLKEDG